MYLSKVVVDHNRVSETATNFVYQVDLSDQISIIDTVISSASHITVCEGGVDLSDVQPVYVIYEAGVKCLVYWDGSISSTVDTVFYIVFDSSLSTVNSASTFTNSNIGNCWGFDGYSGGTILDYTGNNNGTNSGTDTVSSAFGIGQTFDAATDNINIGSMSTLNTVSAFTVEFVVKWSNFSSSHTQFIAYVSSGNFFYVQSSTTEFIIFFNNTVGSQSKVALSGNFSADTEYAIAIRYDGAGSTNADRMQLYVDGNKKTLSYVGTVPAATGTYSTVNTYIGYTSFSHAGTLDEFAIHTDTKSSGWVTNRYRSLFDTTFMSVGAVKKRGGLFAGFSLDEPIDFAHGLRW